MFIQEEIEKRKIPDLFTMKNGEKVTAENWAKRREELLKIMAYEVYGKIPTNECEVTYEESGGIAAYCGTVYNKQIIIHVTDKVENKKFDFPAKLFIPKRDYKVPMVISIGFSGDAPYKYLPVEEITDMNVAILHFGYEDITLDQNEWESGLSAIYTREKYDIGKISMWAWACMRALDAIYDDERIDKNKIAVAGHSRLGKTAMWTAANDERFTYAFGNDAGCSGDAITRMTKGERVADITGSRFPYWFNKRYPMYANREDEMPFDQHFMISCIAPRHLATGAATEDIWADPESQYLSIKEADKVWKMLGETGLLAPDNRFPTADENYSQGSISFHLRYGSHFFSRRDWLAYLSFMLKD